jgi:hypothetical protein
MLERKGTAVINPDSKSPLIKINFELIKIIFYPFIMRGRKKYFT